MLFSLISCVQYRLQASPVTSEEVTEDIGSTVLLPSLYVIHFPGLSGSTTLSATDLVCVFRCNNITKYVFMDIGITGK